MLTENRLVLSEFDKLYSIIIPEKHILKQIKDLVDFEFIYQELKDKYCLDNGRPAEDPIRMFKYLFLKTMYDLSDQDLVDRALTDLAFKYFLDIAPESQVINSSSLTKFRKLRLTDEGILDKLIMKTVEIALNNGIVLSHTIIVDSTHTGSRFNLKSPTQILIDVSKNLRKSVYQVDEKMKEKFPVKPTDNELEHHLQYCKELIKVVKNEKKLNAIPAITNHLNYLEEIVNDDIEQISSLNDPDVKVGHKSADTAFFGYKTHIAMTPERIITAATVTTGEKPDGKELKTLIEKTEAAGVKVEATVGDMAYSEKENIEMAKEKEIKLVSKLSKTVTDFPRPHQGFTFNKDAQRFVCPAGHMSIRITLNGKKKNQTEGTPIRETHFFDINKCKNCPLNKECGYHGQASKSYTVTIKKDSVHEEHEKYQETDEFKILAKERYKIEAKNAELKQDHGYDESTYSGLFGMTLQAAMSIFVVNLKRILTIKDTK